MRGIDEAPPCAECGRFGSQGSWDEFTQWQWITSRRQAHGFPF